MAQQLPYQIPHHYPPTHGVYPLQYKGRKLPLNGNKWPAPQVEFRNGEPELIRTDEGLEGVPGYFQARETRKVGNRKTKVWVYVHLFQRRRGLGVGDARANRHQVPISNGFIDNYSNEQLQHMRRMIGIYKLPFWDSKKYTPLQAHQWNQWLYEHPNQQHRLPVPRTPGRAYKYAHFGEHAPR
jgi:hypothetical protein